MIAKLKNRILVLLLACTAVFSFAFAATTLTAFADDKSAVSTVTMVDGAAIRLDEHAGIKYLARIDGYDADSSDEYGMMILPYSYIDGMSGDYHANLAAKGLKVLDKICTPFTYNNSYYIAFTMTDVRYTNYNREFVGIAYKKTDNAYTYAEISKANNVRTLADVALRAKNGESYNSLEQGQQKIIDDYVTYSSVKSMVAIDEDFASGDVSNWNVKENENYLNIDGSNGQFAISTQSYTGITEISYDLRLHETDDTKNAWVGITTTPQKGNGSDNVYSAWVLCRASGFTQNGTTLDKDNDYNSFTLSDDWVTLKYTISNEKTLTLTATKGQDTKTIGTFTTTDKTLNAGPIYFSVGGGNLNFDIDNFTVIHSGGSITENFNKANSISDTIFTKKTSTATIIGNAANLYANTGKYLLSGGAMTASSWILSNKNYNNITSYGFNINFVATSNGWSGFTLNGQYDFPFQIFSNKITKYKNCVTLYDTIGTETTDISVDLLGWHTFRIVPTSSTAADIYVGKIGETLTKIGYYVSSDTSVCPISSGTPKFMTQSNNGVKIANFTVSYKDGETTKTVSENFNGSYTIDGYYTKYENVSVRNDDLSANNCFTATDFTEEDYTYTNNLIAKTAISGGEGMTDNDAIVYTARVNYICGDGKFNITLNYADNNYNEYIAIENGKATYYVGETAGSSVDFTAETGAEITLEIKVYKSGAISLRVNDADNAVTLRTSGTTGTFAIFAVSGTTKITSIKAISYSIHTNA